MTDFDPNEQFAPDRLNKRQTLAETGHTPYPHTVPRDIPIGEFTTRYADQESIDDPAETLSLAGRVTRINDFGGITFLTITDTTDDVQLVFRDEVTDAYADRSHIDTGDILSATGQPIRTDTGELSLEAETYQMATKSVQHPPSHDGLNARQRIQNRGAALQHDAELQDAVRTRFELTQTVRQFLTTREYLEVETPILHQHASGADATPFTTQCAAKETEMVLRIAPELYLKRLLVGGFERVFELGKDFRNESIDTTHNPEFSMLELYEAYADYEDMMHLVETLVAHVLDTVTGSLTVEYADTTLDFTPPWDRCTLEESIERYADIPVSEYSTEAVRDVAAAETAVSADVSRGEAYLALYEELVEDAITGPVFITDHPRESTPLCKPHRDDPTRVERFEVVVCGIELANAYTERTDPVAQAEQFIQQADEDADVDTQFLREFGHGMPPAAGLGLGIDRLAMLATDSQSIKDVLAFPMTTAE